MTSPNTNIQTSNVPALARRYSCGNTGETLKALLALQEDPNCFDIWLFASPRTPTARFNPDTDDNETNLPLLTALVRYRMPLGFDPMYIVFDSMALTAARKPRYNEVKQLLDKACQGSKTFVCLEPLDFTSSMPPEQAAAMMLGTNPTTLLDVGSRPKFFDLLSSLEESMVQVL